MDINKIKEIVTFMEDSGLTELEFEKDGEKIRLHRGQAFSGINIPMPSAPIQANTSTSSPTAIQDDSLYIYKSPMVGTFYRSPSPDSAPFIDTGSQVKEDTVVGIIEAMKVMNEIQAETRGEIVDILVDNGQTIEFGQPLFKIKKA